MIETGFLKGYFRGDVLSLTIDIKGLETEGYKYVVG